MNTKKYFDYNPELELTAAQIGINKWNWISDQSDDLAHAKTKMKEYGFDVLPIEKEGQVIGYFKTLKWGDYSNIDRFNIEEAPKVYYRLSFYDLMVKMRNERQTFYFLVDSNEILGLVSLNNFNCLAVYNYIYQVTAGLERAVSDFIQEISTEVEVIAILKNSSDKSAVNAVAEFEKAKALNADNSIYQSIYLPHMCTLIKNLNIPDSKADLKKYRKKFSSTNTYGSIRNDVAHPIRPLVTNIQSLDRIDELISDYYTILALLST